MRKGLYICSICSKEYDRKSNYEVHLNRKKSCDPNIKTKSISYIDNLKSEYNAKFEEQAKKFEELQQATKELEKKLNELLLSKN